jgi:hypothetical protein
MSKCFVYVLYWDLSEGKHRLLLLEEFPGGKNVDGSTFRPISLTYGDTSEKRHKLECVSLWVGRRTLGI